MASIHDGEYNIYVYCKNDIKNIIINNVKYNLLRNLYIVVILFVFQMLKTL